MTVFRKQRATIHAGGGPVPGVTAAGADAAAARIAHYGQLAGAGAAAAAAIQNVLASAGAVVVAHGKGIVGPDGSIIGASPKGGPVDSSGAARGYQGGAYGGLVAQAGGGDPMTVLMALLTGGGSVDNSHIGVNPIDLVAGNSNHVQPNYSDRERALIALRGFEAQQRIQEKDREAAERDREQSESVGDEFRDPREGFDPKKASYDPDAVGGGGYNPFFQPAYRPPKTNDGSTGDSEFGGIAASGPGGARSGPRLGASLNDAPLRTAPSGPSVVAAHLVRRITPGGYVPR